MSGGNYYIFARNSDATCEVAGQLVVLTDKIPPVISGIISTNPTDCGLSDGTITITASSGQGSIEYSIDGGTTWQPSNFFSGLNGTNSPYDVRVRNIDGSCEVTGAAQTITDKVTPTFTSVTPTNPSDCGLSDGSIVIVATGSSGTLEYSIDGGINWQATGTFNSLSPGTYNAVIRYNDGTCQENYASNPIILSTPNSPAITDVQFTDPTDCGNTDGTITVTASGGTAPLEYSVDSGATWVANNGAFTGLPGDSIYYVFVRNTDNTCEVYGQSVTLTNKVQPTFTNVASTDPTDCGVCDGTITITANSSVGNAIEYSVDGGITWQSSNVFSNLCPMTYQPRIRNADGTCFNFTSNVTLIQKIQPVITSVTPSNPSNCGVTDGSIVVAATGGSGTLQYSIDGGTNWQASGTFSGLGAGSYNVFVRYDDATCITAEASNPIVLTVPAAATITQVTSTDPTNCSINDGTITITASGGTGSIQYSIDGGATFQNSNVFTGLTGSGYQGDSTYAIRVRNSNGTCLVTGPSATLTAPVAPTISNVVSTDPTDCGVADGTITITATSSAGNALQYSIDGGTTWDGSGTFTGLSGGTYQIRVRNADTTCIVSDSDITLTDKVQPAYTSITPTNPSNCGVNDGSIVISATGVSLEYSIDGGQNWQNSNSFTNLAPGTYNLEIRNGDGSCITPYASNPVTLTAPNAPAITTVASSDPSNCGSADGTIVITATGGTPPLEYSIDGGGSYQSSATFNGLSGGTYQIRVRNQTGSSCVVTYPDVVLTDKVAPTIASVVETQPTDCGVADATITITASSSVGNAIEYSIDGGTTYQSSNVFSGLSGANSPYEIRVRNADGTCVESSADVTITDKITPVVTNVTSTNPTNCGVNDGTITITATGGSGTLEYSIDGGTNYQASNSFSGLSAGTYNVVVRYDNVTCEVAYASNPVILTVPNAPTITNVASTDPTNCGNSDGTITITATGGSGSYEFSIDGGTDWTNTTGLFTGLTAAGNPYQIMVRNADNTCEITGSIVNLTDPVAPTISNVAFTNETDCDAADGTITITATSSVGNAIEYSINGGTTYQSSNVFTGLDATGNAYEIRVRNVGNTCVVSSADINLTDKITPAITGVTPSNPTNCGVNDGSIVIAATGGSGTLEYSIDGGTNFQASSTFSSLGAGTYNVIVRYTDVTCVVAYASNPVILTVPNAPTITNVASTDPTNCGSTDGTITVTASGGTAPLEYSINGGTSWFANGGSFTGLDASNNPYQIMVRNADNTCEVTGSIVNLTDPVAPTISATAFTNETDCDASDGTITITATSSVGNAIEYSIDGGTTYQSSNVFTGLDASNNPYEIRVRNVGNTCVVSSADINLTDKIQPTFTSVTPTNPSNCGVSDGSIVIVATGASIEYSIDGGTNWQNSGSFTGLDAGTYNLFVRNTDGTCNTPYASNSVILTAPNAPSITNVTFTDPTDCGSASGTITISAVGGSGSLEYSIDSGDTFQASNVFNNLSGGVYGIRVRNASTGTCEVSYPDVTLTDKVAPVIASTVATQPTDCGLADATITITASSSIGNAIEYSIDGGTTYQSSNVFSGLSGANSPYEIRVRNADGTCVVSDADVTITDKITPVVTNVTPTDPSNCGVNDGSIVITATGGSGTLEYSIDGGTNYQASNTFSSLGAGTYDVFVRYNNVTCEVAYASNSITLTVPNAPTITNVAFTDPTNCGNSDGTITITASGGTAPLEYSIDGGSNWVANGGTFTSLDASNNPYQVMVRNADNTCEVTGSIVNLTDPVAPTISNVAFTDETNCGASDGTITITATSSVGNAIEYSIDGGTTYQSSNIFTGLDASGNPYEIRVRNVGNTCVVSSADITLTDKITPVITSVTPTNPSNCNTNDGSIVVVATGGSGTLEYSIDGGTTWQASATFSGLSAGTYNVFVRYNNVTCEVAYASNSVTLTVPNAATITNVAFTDPTNCGVTDGTITVTASGGTAPLEYSINGGGNWFANGGSFTGLDASNNPYQIMVRNADNTCEVTGSIVNLTDPVAPTISATVFTNETDCDAADGTIIITATSSVGNAIEYSIDGGTTYQSSNVFTGLDASNNPYEIRVRNVGNTCVVSDTDINLTDKVQPTFTSVTPTNPSNCGVSDGSIVIVATGASIEYSIDGGTNWQNSGTFNSLDAGTYNVFVRNTDGSCNTPYASNSVILTAPNAPSITNVTFTDPTDCGSANGTITISAVGGSGSLEYSIDSGTTFQASNVFNSLSGGVYGIRVRNATTGTCEVSYPDVTLTDKVAPVIASTVATQPTDCGLADATITITASSSVGNAIEYSIDGGTTYQSSNVFSGLSGANSPYEIRVRNADGTCVVSDADVTITDKITPVVTNVTPTDPSNCGVNDGSIVITATGGSGTLEYSIDGGTNYQASGTFSSLGAGTYNVFVRYDNATCEVAYASNSVTLTVPNAPTITNVASTDPTDCGNSDGTITVTASGGTGPLEYSINGGTNCLQMAVHLQV